MTVKGIAQYRKKLEAKRKELDAGLSKNQEAVKSYTGNDGIRDYADMAQRAYTKEFLYSLSNEERRVLGLVDEALSRINNKEYGICVVCSKEVQKKRLEAVPWARHCIQCQEKLEEGLPKS